jgi:hypothetical protein
MTENLNPERALIFRIVDVANVPWILDHGLHCKNAPDQDPDFVNIGSAELIGKRAHRQVPVPPGGVLSDYVPFYFTPFSIMMFNIKTGWGGITRRENRDIVIFVSSIHRLRELGLPFLFTNQHAYPVDTEFYSRTEDLDKIDWPLLQSKNFKTSDADPGRQVRYQAEALVHRHVPLNALIGIGCNDGQVCERLQSMVETRGLSLSVKATPIWYF